MRQQLAKMIASQPKLIASIRAMAIKIASVNVHVIMRRVLMHVHVTRDALMAVHARMKANIAELVRRVLKKNISYAKN